MAKKKVRKKQDDSKLFAWVAAFFSIIGFVIAMVFKRDDEYVMFYAAQSLVIFIVAIVANILDVILAWIPILGVIIKVALGILVFLLWLFSWIYALSGEKKDVPVVGEWARKMKL